MWHAGVQAGSTAPLALQGMCNDGSGNVGGSGRPWTAHDSMADGSGSRIAAAATLPVGGAAGGILGCRLAPPLLWHSKGCAIVGEGRWEGLQGPGLSMTTWPMVRCPAAPPPPLPRRHRRSCCCAMLGCRMALSCHWHFKGCVIVGEGRWEGRERNLSVLPGGTASAGQPDKITVELN